MGAFLDLIRKIGCVTKPTTKTNKLPPHIPDHWEFLFWVSETSIKYLHPDLDQIFSDHTKIWSEHEISCVSAGHKPIAINEALVAYSLS